MFFGPYNKPRILLFLLVACTVLITINLSACTQSDGVTIATDRPSLSGSSWQVVEMLDLSTGSDLAREVDSGFDLVFDLNADGTVSGKTTLNELDGQWQTDGASIDISLGPREVVDVDDEELQLLMIDYSMGTVLVEADRFLLSDDANILTLFDNSGRMVMRAEAIK
ncbi:MAG: hypothetical protein FWE87_06280 [Coriobacteriia bacterium]|nr:hypothetical protein [Coriobacteriia bacterium]